MRSSIGIGNALENGGHVTGGSSSMNSRAAAPLPEGCGLARGELHGSITIAEGEKRFSLAQEHASNCSEVLVLRPGYCSFPVGRYRPIT